MRPRISFGLNIGSRRKDSISETALNFRSRVRFAGKDSYHHGAHFAPAAKDRVPPLPDLFVSDPLPNGVGAAAEVLNSIDREVKTEST